MMTERGISVGEQSLDFPSDKTQTAIAAGSKIPGVFPNGLPDFLSIGAMHTDNASSLEDSVANGYNINYFPGFQHLGYGDSAYDARQRLTARYNYEIPLALDLRGYTYARMALGGWHFSGITALQGGFPVTIATIEPSAPVA